MRVGVGMGVKEVFVKHSPVPDCMLNVLRSLSHLPFVTTLLEGD